MNKMKIGFIPKSLLGWGGGKDFLYTLLYSLRNFSKKNDLDIHIFVDKDDDSNIDELKILDFKIVNIGKIEKTIIAESSVKHELQLIVAFGFDLGILFPIPWISYIPDFQHKYLTSLFLKSEIKYRDRNFRMLYENAEAVIVNSKSAECDIVNFLNGDRDKVLRLPFAPILKKEFLDYQGIEILPLYSQVSKRYFLISNQFWIHKSHKTAFETFKLLSEQYPEYKDVQLVCTGSLQEYRDVKYINELIDYIKVNDLEDKIILLGHIPKAHQIALLSKSIALIQPTLFEGGPGGGSTYEAISLNKRVILSDIAINKEVTKGRVYFFQAGSAESLLEKVIKVLRDQKKYEVMLKADDGVEEIGMSLCSGFQKVLSKNNIKFQSKKLNIYNNEKNLTEDSTSENVFNLYTYLDDQIILSPYAYHYLNKEQYENALLISGLRIVDRHRKLFFKEISSEYLFHHYGPVNKEKNVLNSFVLLVNPNIFDMKEVECLKPILLQDSLLTLSIEDYFYKFVLRDIDSDTPLYIYGDGEHTIKLLKHVDFSLYNLKGILAKEPKECEIANYKVESIQSENFTKDIRIIVSSASFETEIYEDLIAFFEMKQILRIYGY